MQIREQRTHGKKGSKGQEKGGKGAVQETPDTDEELYACCFLEESGNEQWQEVISR